MLIESDFFSGEHLRWNLGWASPNYAGAFVAMLLVTGFAFSVSRWRWWFWGVEAGGFFLLAKTYSRGALVAWGAAWLFGVLSTGGLLRKGRWVWLARLLVLCVILFSVGFQWKRDEPHRTDVGQMDRSVTNRLELWTGALKMLASAPERGWGGGESGHAYRNWFQDLERDESFTTMVNSYLSIAVDYGLPIFALGLIGFVMPLIGAWQLARAGSSGAMAAGASLVVWMSVNVFSTLWIEWRIWCVPGLSIAFLIWRFWGSRKGSVRTVFLAALFVSTTTGGVLYWSGRELLKEDCLQISPRADGSVILSGGDWEIEEWHIWPDTAVLGEFIGKELRRWFLEKEPRLRVVVHSTRSEGMQECSDSMREVVLLGKQAERCGDFYAANCEGVWIIYPTVPPPMYEGELPRRIVVVLPQIDELGNGRSWENWVRDLGADLIISKGSGLDICSVWAEILSGIRERGDL